jgi:hypothetical protein
MSSNLINRTSSFVLALCLALLPALSSAQLVDLKSTRNGEGSMNFGARASNERVTRVTVWLQERGVIGITLAQGVKDTFEGKWRQVSSRRVDFTLTKIGRDSATGSGHVDLDGRGSFTRVSLNGRTGGTPFSFSFTVNDDGGDIDPGDSPLINRTEWGQGNWNWGSRASESNVKSVRVRMTSDHRIEIDPSPGSNDSVSGHWWRKSSSQIGFDIDRLDGSSATGTGTVTLDGRGSFSRIDLSGRSQGSNFAMAFRVTGSPDEGSGDLSSSQRQRFINVAREGVRREFSGSTRFDFSGESVGGVAFGDRRVTGSFRARGGNRPGNYRYEAVVRNGTVTLKSVTVRRA